MAHQLGMRARVMCSLFVCLVYFILSINAQACVFPIISVNCTISDNTDITEDIIINEGVTVTVSKNNQLRIIAKSLTLKAGAVIYGSGAYYSQGRPNSVGYVHPGSASHAGNAYGAFLRDENYKSFYGDFREPQLFGSDGSDGLYSYIAGDGGKAIYIKVEEFNNAGTISMDGTPGTDYDYNVLDYGGGSGGSIYINCTTLTNVGSLSVRAGGREASAGRIALYYETGNQPNMVDAVLVSPVSAFSAPASVYVEHLGTKKSLYALCNCDQAIAPLYSNEYLNHSTTIYGLAGVAENFTFDYIYASANAKILFPNDYDGLIVNSNTVLESPQNAFIFVAGTLEITQEALRDSQISFGVLSDGRAVVPSDLVIASAHFLSYGQILPSGGGPMKLSMESSATRKSSFPLQVHLGNRGTNNGEIGSYDFDNITIADGDIVTYNSDWYLDTQGPYNVVRTGVTLTGDYLYIGENSSIDASNQGFRKSLGDGFGAPAEDFNVFATGGGGHGGRGSWLYKNYNALSYPYYIDSYSKAYGDYREPITLGSGGGAGTLDHDIDFPVEVKKYAGAGGGAIHLAYKNIYLNSNKIAINADAYFVEPLNSTHAGGGAGGSIWIECEYLGYTKGSISANGATYNSIGYGGGGRIALYIMNYDDVMPFSATGSSAGTVFTLIGDNSAELIVDNKNNNITGLDTGILGNPEYVTPIELEADEYEWPRMVIRGGAQVRFTGNENSQVLDKINGDESRDGIVHWHAQMVQGDSFNIFKDATFGIAFQKESLIYLPPGEITLDKFYMFNGLINGTEDVDLTIFGATVQFGPYGNTNGQHEGHYKFKSISIYESSEVKVVSDFLSRAPNFTVETLVIEEGSSFHSDALGYRSSTGDMSLSNMLTSGRPPVNSDSDIFSLLYGFGGGHAGRPVLNLNEDYMFGYGYVDTPNTLGTAGTQSIFANTAPGGAGGGAVVINVTVKLDHRGRISADGQSYGLDYTGNYGPLISGAGGSVRITCAGACTAEGDGVIQAKGGAFGGASGGRVALYLPVNEYNVSADAQADGGAAGTLLISLADARGTLFLQNSKNALNPTDISPNYYGTIDFSITNDNAPMYVGYDLHLNPDVITYTNANAYPILYAHGNITRFTATKFGGLLALKGSYIELIDNLIEVKQAFAYLYMNGEYNHEFELRIDDGFRAMFGGWCFMTGLDHIRLLDVQINGYLYTNGRYEMPEFKRSTSEYTEHVPMIEAQDVEIATNGQVIGIGPKPREGRSPAYGDQHSVESNSGSYFSSGYNSGGYNSGGYNSGGYNSGGYNSGGYNSGGYNSGGYNSGSYNSGSYNSGDYDGDRVIFSEFTSPAHASCGYSSFISGSTGFIIGSAYGNFSTPTAMGSGGWLGNGGGAIHLKAQNVMNSGRISVDGQGGDLTGSAGSIWIECNEISGSGYYSAQANMHVYFLEGSHQLSADGRIAIHYNVSNVLGGLEPLVSAGTFYEYNRQTDWAIIYAHDRYSSEETTPVLIDSLPVSVEAIYIRGGVFNFANIATRVIATIVPEVFPERNVRTYEDAIEFSAFANYGVISIKPHGEIGMAITQNTHIQTTEYPGVYYNLMDMRIMSDTSIFNEFINYGVIHGGDVRLEERAILRTRIGEEQGAPHKRIPFISNSDRGRINGYLEGHVVINSLEMVGNSAFVFDEVTSQAAEPNKRATIQWDFFYDARALLVVYTTVTMRDNSVITSAGEGAEAEDSISCFGGTGGGGRGGYGGGSDRDSSNYDSKSDHPTRVGLGPKICSDAAQYYYNNNDREIAAGGGVIHMSAREIQMYEAATITVNGTLGGGGGSMWIDAGTIIARGNNAITARGTGGPSGLPSNSLICGGGGTIAMYTIDPVDPTLYGVQQSNDCEFSTIPALPGTATVTSVNNLYLAQSVILPSMNIFDEIREDNRGTLNINFGMIYQRNTIDHTVFETDEIENIYNPYRNTPGLVVGKGFRLPDFFEYETQLSDANCPVNYTVLTCGEDDTGKFRIQVCEKMDRNTLVKFSANPMGHLTLDYFNSEYINNTFLDIPFSAIKSFFNGTYTPTVYTGMFKNPSDPRAWYLMTNPLIDDPFTHKFIILGNMTVGSINSSIQHYIDDEYIHVQVHFPNNVEDFEFSFEIKVVEPPVITDINPKGPWYYDGPGGEYENYHPGEVITIIGNKLELDPSASITIDGKPIGPVVYSDSGSIVVVLPRGTQPGLLQIITKEGDSVPFNIPNIGERTFEGADELTCVSWGDPHFTKYNGDVFHFQGRGEYLLASVGGVTIQSRQIPCGASVTCNTAVVVRYGDNYFEVNSDQSQLHTYVNKVREEIIFSTFTVAQNFNVTRVSRYEYIIRAPFVQIRAIFTPWVDLYVTTYPVSFPTGTTTKGLCGGLNMQWAFSNETTAPVALTQEFINEYGESWRVTPTTSNFYYPPTTGYNDYNDPSVVLPVDEPVYNDTKAVNLCNLIAYGAEGNLAEQCTMVPQVGYYYYACLQDAAITGDYATVENSIAAFAKACSDIKNGDIGNVPLLGSRSIATGPGVQPNGVAAAVETYFTITPRDALDKPYENGLNYGDFEVTIVGPGGVAVTALIREETLFANVDYVAPTPGKYNITVVYTPTSAPIMGSPFIVNVGSEANCVSWGDPHFTTYAGVAYDFQGFGEYVLANASGVEIQVRQEPCGRGVTCNYAIAAKDQTNTIALYSKNNVITSYIDNTVFTPNSTTGLIRKVSSYEYQFVFPDRFKVVIRNYGRLDVTVYMSTTTEDFAIGGGLCGIESKDWKFSDGQLSNFVATPRTSQFLNSFGESWRVTPAQSLFNYGVTNSSYPVQNPTDYVPTDEIEPSETPVCDELSVGLSADQCKEYVDPTPYYDSCLFDVAATGNTSMAYASIIAYATICTTVIGTPRVYPTIAEHSYAEGPGIEPTGISPLEPIGFAVYAIDAIGNPQSNNVPDNVQVRLVQSPSGNLSEIDFVVSQFNTYIHNVTYIGRRPGASVIEILINGEPIRGSPFVITFGPFVPSAPNSDAYGPGIGQDGAVYAHFETHFVITARNSINDLTFGATFTISSADVASFSQTDNGDGTYLVSYATPGVAKDISIAVTYSGNHIIGSPFTVAVKDLKPTVTCISWGDPHFTMFGSRVFNFQGFGEYILARIGGLEVQVRQATCNLGVTCNFAIAGREGETTLALYLNNRVVSAYVNGENTTNLSRDSALNTISQQNSYQYSLTFPSAVVQVRSYSTRLDFTVVTDCNGTYPSNPLNGGLCGEWNGFLPLANGTRFSGKITQKHIDAFGESWRVPNAGQSFFDYTNSSFIENNPTTFVPNYNQTTENTVVLDEVDRICSELKNGSAMVEACKDFVNPTPFYDACKFDVIASGKGLEGQASVVTYAALCQHATANNSNVPVIPYPAIAEHTYADGPGLEPTGRVVNQDTYFLVHVVDALGKPSNVSGIIVTSVSNTDSNLAFVINGTDRTGVFNVTYTPSSASTHVITVRIVGSNLEISGSPFTVVIELPCSQEPCGPGFECVGFNCVDVNECRDVDKCPANHKCVNLPGSYYCKDLACPGNCKGRGVCQEGTCVCDNPYTGPGCEGETVALVLDFSPHYPSVIVKATDKIYEISITELRELNIRSETVQSVPIPPLKFTLDNVTNEWKYSLNPILSSSVRSALTVNFFHHVEPFFIQFAGINVSRPQNTLKMAATVTSWPFKSVRNRLALVTTSTVVQDADACFDARQTVKELNSNLIWIKDEIEQKTLFGQYLQNAIVDGRNTEMINQFNHSANEALLILPHFYDAASLDPDFSVLVDDTVPDPVKNDERDEDICGDKLVEEKKKKKSHVIPIVATICSVVGVAMIVAAIMFMKSRNQKNATMQRLQSARSRSVSTNSQL